MWAVTLAVVCMALWPFAHVRADAPDQIRERLRSRIETAFARGVNPGAAREPILADDALLAFYERRAYQPVWSRNGRLLPHTDALLAAIRGAEAEGLRPPDYHLADLEDLTFRLRSPKSRQSGNQGGLWVDLEILCTDAFLVYGSHCLAGRVDPRTIDPEWFADPRQKDLLAALEEGIESGEVRRVLGELLPAQPGYARLRQALADYRALAAEGGWPQIAAGAGLRKGDRGPRVAELQIRLLATDDFPEGEIDSVFSAATDAAVRRFQDRYGLEPDGIVGPETLAMLNRTPADRVQQIAVNLERWRWLPDDLGRRHVVVNIANFSLDMVEDERRTRSMRVIVGRTYRRTPVFSDRITYLVLNPSWNVPASIVAQDILPLVRRDSTYLEVNGFDLLESAGGGLRTLDPASFTPAMFTGKTFPYLMRQRPGPRNALGRIKFMFPNSFNVYLHDTPTRGLFAKAKRDFSSGCIRIEDPQELAVWLLADGEAWSRAKLQAAIDENSERTVRVPQAVPIHLQYWTAWVTPDGTVHFRDDIYNRDGALAQALHEDPPTESTFP